MFTTELDSGAAALQFTDQVLAQAALLLYVGVAFVVMFRARFTNLGLAGQFVAASLAASVTAAVTGSALASLASCLLAALLVGRLYVEVYRRLNIQDVLVTFIVSGIIVVLCNSIMRLTSTTLTVGADAVSQTLALPKPSRFVYTSYLHFVALMYYSLAWFASTHTVFGYMSRAHFGSGEDGWLLRGREIRVVETVAIAIGSIGVGLAAFADLFTEKLRFIMDSHSTISMLALAVGAMATKHIALVLPMALLISIAETASRSLSSTYRLPSSALYVVYGLVVLVGARGVRR